LNLRALFVFAQPFFPADEDKMPSGLSGRRQQIPQACSANRNTRD
jgi:hypothetical protein